MARPTRFLRREKSPYHPRRAVRIPSADVPAGGGWPNIPTSVTAGTPGYFSPYGSEPYDLTMLQNSGVTPAGDFTTGQSVTLGDGSSAYYATGSWSAGTAP